LRGPFPPALPEDADYRYFVAPQRIEYRGFRNGTVVDGRFIPGGLFLAKSLFTTFPSAGASRNDYGGNARRMAVFRVTTVEGSGKEAVLF
jgi:hypothetical protein